MLRLPLILLNKVNETLSAVVLSISEGPVYPWVSLWNF